MTSQRQGTGVDPDYPIDPVPRPARRSAFSVLTVLLGFTFFTPTMLAGAQVGQAFSAVDFLLVLLLGRAGVVRRGARRGSEPAPVSRPC